MIDNATRLLSMLVSYERHRKCMHIFKSIIFYPLAAIHICRFVNKRRTFVRMRLCVNLNSTQKIAVVSITSHLPLSLSRILHIASYELGCVRNDCKVLNRIKQINTVLVASCNAAPQQASSAPPVSHLVC